jgi:hypothetical protein
VVVGEEHQQGRKNSLLFPENKKGTNHPSNADKKTSAGTTTL